MDIQDDVFVIGRSGSDNYLVRYLGDESTVKLPASVNSGDYHVYGHAFEKKSVNFVVMPDSVLSLGSYAFAQCTGLIAVTVPSSATAIADRAFYGCNSLSTVTIGESVESIGEMAFYSCNSLFEVINLSNLPLTAGSAGYGGVAAYAMYVLTSEDGSTIEWTDDGYVFGSCDGIQYLVSYFGDETHLELPADHNGDGYEIYGGAFYYHDSLVSVVIPDTVTAIGDNAFGYCLSLVDVTIGGSVESIGNDAFQFCGKLGSIRIPDSVLVIGGHAFDACPSVTVLDLGQGVRYIGEYSFSGCDVLETVTIPDSVVEIGDYAFAWNASLSTVTVGSRVSTIGTYAFVGCDSLYTVNNRSLFHIESEDSSVGSLYATVVNGSVRTVAQDGFTVRCNDSSLVCSIERYEGDGTELQLGGFIIDEVSYELIRIDDLAFRETASLVTVNIPASVVFIGYDIIRDCTSLTSLNVDEDNEFYSSMDGVLFNGSMTELISYPQGRTEQSYAIPGTVDTCSST